MKNILVLTFILLVCCQAWSQCDYVDPSTVGTSTPVFYDLNNDGIDDILAEYSNGSFAITGKNGTQIETNGNGRIKAYNPNVTIGVGTFANNAIFATPDFPKNTIKFAGIKIIVNTVVYYGWVSFEYSDFDLRFEGYNVDNTGANYCTHFISQQPNTFVKTGQAVITSIEENKFEDSKLVLQNKQLKIDAVGISFFDIEVYDVTGKLIEKKKDQNNKSTIDLSNVSNQLLIINIVDTENPSIRRVFKTFIE